MDVSSGSQLDLVGGCNRGETHSHLAGPKATEDYGYEHPIGQVLFRLLLTSSGIIDFKKRLLISITFLQGV